MAEVSLSALFPDAQNQPICALCAIEEISDNTNPYGPRRFNQAMRRLKHHQPSPTLTKSEVPGSDSPFAGQERIEKNRNAVIASFPLAFDFSGQWTDAINRIGNSVPPLFMRSIARHIAAVILEPCRNV